jgi:hypothetical protein
LDILDVVGPAVENCDFMALRPNGFIARVRPLWDFSPRSFAFDAATPMKTEHPDAGCLFKAEHLPSLHLSLEVTRGQFSDMLRFLEAKRLKDFHFTVEEGENGSWPIHSWGSTGLRAGGRPQSGIPLLEADVYSYVDLSSVIVNIKLDGHRLFVYIYIDAIGVYVYV